MRVRVSPSRRKSKAPSLEAPDVKVQLIVEPDVAVLASRESIVLSVALSVPVLPEAMVRSSMSISAL